MLHNRIRITIKPIFFLLWAILLLSRILVLIDSYNWPINPVLIELAYIFASSVLVLLWNRGKIKLRRGNHILVLGIMLLHTVLWGLFIVDRSFIQEISSHFKSQIMFVAIIWVTVMALQQFEAIDSFIKCSYYTLVAVLLYFFLTHLSELDLSGLTSVLSLSDRVRANFGFGHYNHVGSACVCGIIMRQIVKKDYRTIAEKMMSLIMLLVMICMLLNSASRNAITSVAIFFFAYYNVQKDKLTVSPRIARTIDFVSKFLLGILLVWSVFEIDFGNLLQFSQRSHLVDLVLPMFFDTGEIWLGLGYASTAAYAEGLTPYVTRWMDNAYIYYLVTTGIVGLGMILAVLAAMGYSIYKRRGQKNGIEAFSAFLVYVYISLFEAILFNSGVIINYIYLPWLLVQMTKIDKKKIQHIHSL